MTSKMNTTHRVKPNRHKVIQTQECLPNAGIRSKRCSNLRNFKSRPEADIDNMKDEISFADKATTRAGHHLISIAGECTGGKAHRVSNSPPTSTISGNNREKWRQQNVNKAFISLRRLVPTHPPDKRLSKHEILRMAIKYIRLLEWILAAHSDENNSSNIQSSSSDSSSSA